MIKHYCDICGKELKQDDYISHMIIDLNARLGDYNKFDEMYILGEICEDCRKNLITHIKCLKNRLEKSKR